MFFVAIFKLDCVESSGNNTTVFKKNSVCARVCIRACKIRRHNQAISVITVHGLVREPV